MPTVAPSTKKQHHSQKVGSSPQHSGAPPPQHGGFFPEQGGIHPQQQGGVSPPQTGGNPPQQGNPPHEVVPSQSDIKEPSDPSFEIVAGYESAAGLDAVPAGPPPPYLPSNQPQVRPDEHFDSSAQITHSEACDALMEFVSQHCCYGKGAAKEMEIKDMKHSSAYHYKLESFTETRAFSWCQEPYTGQVIDGPMNGRAPGAWEMQVEQPAPFAPTTLYQEIPHTASIHGCKLQMKMSFMVLEI